MDTPVEKYLPVSQLSVDTKVQREQFDDARVVKMVSNFKESAMGIITVSERDDGTFVIVDGWHRWEAKRRVSDNAGQVRCDVYTGLTLADEADLFLLLNTTNSPKVLDKFRVRVVRGDKFALEIRDILAAYHWTIGPSITNGTVNAVSALEKVHGLSQLKEADPPLLQLVFLTINRAWGDDRYAAQAPMIVGLGSLYAEHGSLIDVDRMVTILKRWKGGPEGLITSAKTAASLHRMRVGYALADLVTDEYNLGLRTKTLPSWRTRR